MGGGGPFDVSGGPSVVLEISRTKFKILELLLQILKIMKNFEKLRRIISKVGGQILTLGAVYQSESELCDPAELLLSYTDPTKYVEVCEVCMNS